MANLNKQDRQAVRTAADLERKYDLASIAGIKKAVKNSEVNINKTNKTLENFIASTLGSIDDLQNQIDGNITTWFYDGVPTLENLPANEWTTDEDKANHIGDLYYDRDTGYAYRFMLSDTYEWLKLSDSDVIEALALANAASDTADSKRRVFTDTPYPPYDNGDLWFKDGDIYICQISKGKEETYAERDFIIATKYTDDTVAKQVGDELNIVKGTVTEIKEGVDQFKVSITETVEAMDEEIETAKSEIEMTSQEIELRVKKDNIIAAINASAEKIKIAAKYLELAGTITISALDEELSSMISKASSDSSLAMEAANNALNTVNNLEIGGRNYFSSKKQQTAFDENNEYALPTYQNKGSYKQFYNLTVPMSYFVGKNCKLSFDAISPNGDTELRVYNDSSKPRYLMNTIVISKIGTTWVHQELTITVTDKGETYTESTSNKIEFYFPTQMGCKIRNVKLEIGNKATDWTPAPEDVESEITTVSNTANTANNKVTYRYGTCSTSEATVEKVVTLSGFTLYTGATVTVYFSYANTASNPTLNVNGTGAKNIRVKNTNIAKAYYWGASDTVTFTYNGSYWVMSDTSANAILASWCYNNDKTYIDGGNIYARTVTAEKIATDAIKSLNYIANASGSFLNLADGSFDSKYLKWNSEGELTCTKGDIGGFSMSDKLTATISGVYIDPSSVEINKIRDSIKGNYTLTTQEREASDLNADGSVTIKDLLIAQKISFGVVNYSDYPGAKTSSVTVEINPKDPKKLIKLSGTNAWGRYIEQYFGINGINVGNILSGVVTGDIVQTSAGADLDTINSNLTYTSNSNGKCWKFPNGIQICTKLVEFTTTCNTPWGSMFETPELNLGGYALNFIDIPTVSVVSTNGSGAYAGIIEAISSTSSTSFGNIILTRPNSVSSVMFRLHLSAIGRWK